MFRRIPPRPTRRMRFPAQKKDENAQWNARKSMARLEMIAGQMYGFDYMDELHKLTDEIMNENSIGIHKTMMKN